MNLEKLDQLKPGSEFKNYKELCALLEEDEKGGNGKRNQLNEWELFFKSHKRGQKIIIDEIYDIPKEDKPLVVMGNGIYSRKIQLLLLNLLSKNEGKTFIIKNKMLNELGITSNAYTFYKRKKEELKDILNVSEVSVNDVYGSLGSFNKNIEAALRFLENSKTIYCIRKTMVKKATDYLPDNDIGENVIDMENLSLESNIEVEYREAEEDEIKVILECEKLALKYIGCRNMQDVAIRNLWNDYESIKNKLTKERANIFFSYEAIEILYTDNTISLEKHQLTKELEKKFGKELVKSISEKIDKDIARLQKYSIKCLNENYIDTKDWYESGNLLEDKTRKSDKIYKRNVSKVKNVLLNNNRTNSNIESNEKYIEYKNNLNK